MNFRTATYEKVLYPLMDGIRGRKNMSRLKLLRESQWWDRSRLEEWQLEKLRSLLRHAEKNVPFYKNRFAEIGFSSENIASIENLLQIPLLSDDDIRNNNDSLRSQNIPSSQFVPGRTGGSTGSPTHFFYDRKGRDWSRATTLRCSEWSGLRLGDKLGTMSGSHFDYSKSKQFFIRLRSMILRTRSFTMTSSTDEVLFEYAHELAKWKPKVLWGYASALFIFSRFVLRTGVKGISPLSVISTSETLLPEWRDSIQEAFGCEVFDHYGQRAFYIAGDCSEHNGYHVNAETLIVEIIRNGQPAKEGEIGKIVVTDLFNYAFPFIRYDTGDIGTWTRRICPCGRTLPLLESIEGRVWDIIVTPDRRFISPPSISLPFSDLENVKAYQVIQERLEEVQVLIAPGPRYNHDDDLYIRNALSEILGDSIRINVQLVEDIPLPESGKRRIVISSVMEDVLSDDVE